MLARFRGGSLDGLEVSLFGPVRSVYYAPAGPNPRRQISHIAWPLSDAYRAVAKVHNLNEPDYMVFVLVGPDGEVGS